MLVHAICSELGAVLFDLTPANIAGKYPGKTGLTMLVHLINKVKITRNITQIVLYFVLIKGGEIGPTNGFVHGHGGKAVCEKSAEAGQVRP